MCAIFGFVARRDSKGSKAPARAWKPAALHAIVRGNVDRGPHAFGFAWIDSRGRLRMFKQTGRMTDRLAALELARDARLLIGHLRFATHGDPRDNLNNHPHPVDGGWLVHNGVIRNHAELIRRYELATVSECDTEVLCRLVECIDEIDGGAPRSRVERIGRASELCEGALAALALWSRPAGIVAVRHGNPLHCSATSEGLYLATLPQGLPGHVKTLLDNHAYRFDAGADGLIHTRTCEVAAPLSQWSFSAGRIAYCGG